MRKCPNCGTLNSDTAKFCKKCGKDLLNFKKNELKNTPKSKKLIWIVVSIVVVALVGFLGIHSYIESQPANSVKGNAYVLELSKPEVSGNSYCGLIFDKDGKTVLTDVGTYSPVSTSYDDAKKTVDNLKTTNIKGINVPMKVESNNSVYMGISKDGSKMGIRLYDLKKDGQNLSGKLEMISKDKNKKSSSIKANAKLIKVD